MLKKSKKGFTIVELVIVIAVIGILSAILIPTFANLTIQAQQTALKSNLANAYSMYASEAGDGEIEVEYTESSSKEKRTVAIEFKGQQEVFLVPFANPDGKGYVYSVNDNGWNIEDKDFDAVFGTSKVKTPVVSVALGDKTAKDFSKFGEFVVYYAADPIP